MSSNPISFIRFRAIDVTNPYKFIKFGAIDVIRPYKCIRFWADLGPMLGRLWPIVVKDICP
jgi:hypothetical protein